MHDFKRDLAYSMKDNEAWDSFYRSVTQDDLISIHRVEGNNEWQRRGVDVVLYLDRGVTLNVEEKKRKKDYGDLLIEQYSDYGKRKEGWSIARDKWTDYLAYAIPSARRCYWIPWHLYNFTCRKYLGQWINEASEGNPDLRYPIDANNGYYITRSLAIAPQYFFYYLFKEMVKPFQNSDEDTI